MPKTLPLELFPVVFAHAEDRELFVLAAISHAFNEFAFQVYFTRHSPDPRQPLQCIDLRTALPSTYLQALVCWRNVVGKNVGTLAYRYDPRNDWRVTLREVRLLTMFLKKVGEVRRLELVLLLPSIKTSGLRQANAELLRVINEKKCEHLDLSGRFTLHYKALFAKKERKHYPDIADRLPILWAKKCLRLKPFNGDEEHESTSAASECKHLVLRHFPLTFRQYHFDSVRASRYTLTSLDLINIPGYASKDFSILLTDVIFPNLKIFCLTSCKGVHQGAIVSFLTRHPNIEYLRYLLVDYAKGTQVTLPIPDILSTSFGKLKRLDTSPRYVQQLLPPLSRLPSLHKITIYTSVGSLLQLCTTLDDALRSMRRCLNDIELTILSPCPDSGLEPWFTCGMNIEAENRPEPFLNPIRQLTLEHQRAGFNEPMFNVLPAWLAMFPNIQQLTLKAFTKKPHHAPYIHESRVARLLSRIEKTSPSIKKVIIDSGKHGQQAHDL